MRLAEHVVALPYRRFCGRTIQGYRIGSIMGIGGSGVVFQASDPGGRPVVLKLLRPMRPSYDLEAVWREVAPLNRVDHPAVPSWLGILREGRAYFIVMSRLPGSTLATWLFERRHAFDLEEVVHVGAATAGAMAQLHACGVAHGDVRPANILYDGDRVSFADFGMSVCAEAGAPAFREACAADVAGFADVLIYLLYASPGVGRRRRSKGCATDWRDELVLTSDQRRFLEDMLAPGGRSSMVEASERFLEAFGPAGNATADRAAGRLSNR